jgi:uncharacterized membrane protein YgcG
VFDAKDLGGARLRLVWMARLAALSSVACSVKEAWALFLKHMTPRSIEWLQYARQQMIRHTQQVFQRCALLQHSLQTLDRAFERRAFAHPLWRLPPFPRGSWRERMYAWCLVTLGSSARCGLLLSSDASRTNVSRVDGLPHQTFPKRRGYAMLAHMTVDSRRFHLAVLTAVLCAPLSCVSDDSSNTSSGKGSSSSSSSSGGGSSSSSSSSSSGASGGLPWDRMCDGAKPFGAPVELMEVNTAANESRARVSPDGLDLYLSRFETQGPSWLLVRFTRDSLSSAWKLAVKQPSELNPIVSGGPTTVMRTSSLAFVGDRGAFISSREGQDTTKIEFATFASALGIWKPPAPVTGLMSGFDDSPWFAASSPDPNKGSLYFARRSDPSGSLLYFAPRRLESNVNTFDEAQPIPMEMPPSQELYAPVLIAGERTMYFASGTTNRRMYVTDWTGTTFRAPVDLAALNASGTFNEPSWISGNGCEIYFTSNRNVDKNGTPHLDVFYARRPR